jgi:hypothetical protein
MIICMSCLWNMNTKEFHKAEDMKEVEHMGATTHMI